MFWTNGYLLVAGQFNKNLALRPKVTDQPNVFDTQVSLTRHGYEKFEKLPER